MKIKTLILSILICSLYSCGSTRNSSFDKISLESFNKLICSSDANVVYSQSKNYQVELPQNEKTRVKIKNGTLIINGSRKKDNNSNIYIYPETI